LFYLYLPIPEPGPVGVSVEPLGEALGPSVLPDGLWVLFGPAGLVVVEPAALPVVDEPVLVPVPVAELPPAEPVPLCARAKVPDSAKAAANAIVVSFMIVSLTLLTKDNPPATSYVPLIFSARQAAHASVLRGGACPPSHATHVGRYARHSRVTRTSGSGVAFSEVGSDLGVSEMVPPLGVAQMFPAILRVEHRALTADGTHGAIVSHVFHCHLPRLDIHELIPSIRVRVITIMCQN
jgi:hypothetical protein